MEESEPPKLAPKPGKVTVYRALCNYVATKNGELSFDEGDLLYVTDSSSDAEWWPAKCYGESGLIPRRLVTSAEHMQFPVHDAAKRGNLEFLKQCIANSVSVNSLDKSASTPLYWASHGGHVEAVRLLTSVPGICVSAQNRIGDTALHAAAWKGHLNCVNALLERGASLVIRNCDRKRPIDVCSDPEAKAVMQLAMSRLGRDDGFPGDYDSESEVEGEHPCFHD